MGRLLQLLLMLQCMKINMRTESVSSTQVKHFHSEWLPQFQNHTDCPMWFNYSSATNDCQCFHFWPLKCNGKIVSADSSQILTYDVHKGLISTIAMWKGYTGGYNMTRTGRTMLPDDIAELNQYMCGPLNRKGYLCGRCRSGYGPAAFLTLCTTSYECLLCQDTWYDVILYLSLELVPITLFYLLILVFQIQLTSPPMTCLIMYSQLVVLAFYEECDSKSSPTLFSEVKFAYTEGTLRMGTKILLTLYGMFNLDFFHHVLPPFCIFSQLRHIHVVFLGYISSFYPFLLILLTWLCVELHDCNFKPIVCLWRPFHGCFVRLRRGWNTKSDLIDVFASFFLLSYCKILYQIILTANSSEVDNYSMVDGYQSQEYTLSADTSIIAGSKTYYLIMTISVLFSFMFIVFPAFLLLLYPVGLFQRLLSKCTSNRFRIILHIFVEKFQSCYKDGLDGAKGLRSFSGFYFLLRITVCLIPVINGSTFHFEMWLVRGFVFSVATLLIALCRPYKKTSMNIIDSILLTHLATLCYVASSNYKSRIYLQFIQTVIAFPFAMFCLKIAYRIARGISKVHFLNQRMSLWFCKSSQTRANSSLTTINDKQQIISSQSKATYGTIISDLP